jgi:DNA-binding CsgD family transcriptional regulator
MSKQRTPPTIEVGLCKRQKKGAVFYQNDMAQSICGNQVGQKCQECEKDSRHPDFSGFGVSLCSRVDIYGHRYEVTHYQDQDQQLTVLFDSPERASFPETAFEALSKREKEIAGLILEGLSNRQLIARLSISKSTLKTHLNKIYQKLPVLKTRRLGDAA